MSYYKTSTEYHDALDAHEARERAEREDAEWAEQFKLRDEMIAEVAPMLDNLEDALQVAYSIPEEMFPFICDDEYPKMVMCTACNGTGVNHYSDNDPCRACDASGVVPDELTGVSEPDGTEQSPIIHGGEVYYRPAPNNNAIPF